jgi:hypothetical protein
MMVSEEAFRAGGNDLAVLEVRGRRLVRLPFGR